MTNTAANIPVFVINLRRDVAKKEYMRELCKTYNFFPGFIQAVDGSLLSEEECKVVYIKEKCVKKNHRSLSKGEIGCALSHKKIYQKMVDESISKALILEDDIAFNGELSGVLEMVNDSPKNWNIVLLGHHSCIAWGGHDPRNIETHCSIFGKQKLNEKYKLARPAECGCGTYGYIIKLEAAKIMLRDLDLICQPIDHYTGVDSSLNLYAVIPAPITICHFLSENYHSMNERNESINSVILNKQASLKKRVLNYFHLYEVADMLRANYVKFKHSVKIPRRYR